jgi:hypothetical protein
MINILLLFALLIIIIIIFIKLYFSYNEKFTTPPSTICPNENSLISDLVSLYGTANNYNKVLQAAKINAEALPQYQIISRLLQEIPNQLDDMTNKINIYSNLLITDRFNKTAIDTNFENIKSSLMLYENKIMDLYQPVIQYNSNLIKQNYDNAINDFQLAYINYDNKLNLYNSCFPPATIVS